MDFMCTELLYDSGPDQCPHTAIHRRPRALVATADVLVGILNPQVQWPAVTPSSGAIATNYMFRRTAMYLWVRVLLSSFTIDTACTRHFPCSLATRTRSLANSVRWSRPCYPIALKIKS
ncbi:hypothetical protein PISMIDRAFT_678151 [Pisolithus microcarpus 441]|uniref:Uncharacterized protein n=1 Tax=Pisolithus microcarpus 441 TaxID=765257 RepID=A0A0C9YHR5_9AGAM|nr:hypothetical protein PISMIDRAFT_678151 [Pisolithus microcarpus 441]